MLNVVNVVSVSLLRSKLQKPRMKLHGCWAFGFTLQLWCLDETSKHDSACIIEILARTIQRASWLKLTFSDYAVTACDCMLVCWSPESSLEAFEICDQNQIQRPRHVCIVAAQPKKKSESESCQIQQEDNSVLVSHPILWYAWGR